MMIDIFSFPLLNKIHQQFTPVQQIELNSECETKFKKVIKQVTKESHHKAIKLLVTKLSNDETLGKNLGFVILKGLEILLSTFHDANKHIVQWSNTALNKSKARKFRGQVKHSDFVVSIVHQSQTVANIFIGKVNPSSQKTNVYKNCCNLI
ncbi:hypothetical protein RhiirA4_470391 [Rhizophagus irregularis]|uniref:Uncharacterized protein n=1 Tax=Rhizophagus irregularis TaxID=588596 RepID=A0A2I1H1C6_9GLOM|nr:hypothetical protein RhiirA4_470391 [Rhizophagus irregularis]